MSGIGCHHAGLLYEERMNIEHAFRNRDLPILITTTTLGKQINKLFYTFFLNNILTYYHAILKKSHVPVGFNIVEVLM